ncbi:MAG: exodeoxyribonuclease III [Thermohalobaculum sp.]|nr:exodeoxyribonuclease III [Thermohalobaculum sp.]
MPITIATWNINSVRLRAGLVARFLTDEAPDILCLQETKSPVDKIPHAVFAELGYGHMVARGEKGYNGVAILSRLPIEDAGAIDWCAKGDARHVAARLPGGVVLHNLYIPAGGDEPDRAINPKFGHKLDFLDQLARWGEGLGDPAILVGDLNIAPLEDDVWSHRQLLKVVSHTPVEVERLARAQGEGGWTDVTRSHIPAPEKLYSWWSYRARDWAEADRGRRLDHIWSRGGVPAVPGSSRILRDWRGAEQPSDHVPVLAAFEIG